MVMVVVVVVVVVADSGRFERVYRVGAL